MKDRTLALAGVVQAAELVRQAAWHGTWSGYSAAASMNSLFQIESESVEQVFGGREHLQLGLETLVQLLHGQQSQNDALRYSLSLLQVERRFVKQRRLQQSVGTELQQIAEQATQQPEEGRDDYTANRIADLYTRTISKLSPRIVVNGRPQFLKSERVVNWVRCLLLAGVRSAVLWDQLGGSRLELLIRRRRILDEARSLLHGAA